MSRSLEIDKELMKVREQIKAKAEKIGTVTNAKKLIEMRNELNALEERRRRLTEEFNAICMSEKQELLEKKKIACKELMEEVAKEDFDPKVKEEFLKEIEQFSASEKFFQVYDEIDTEACSVKEGLNYNTMTGKVDIMNEELDYPIAAKYREHYKTPRTMLERFQLHLEEKSKNGSQLNL